MLKVAEASGLNIHAIETAPDGTVRVLTGEPTSSSGPNPWDAVLPGLTALSRKAAEEAEADAELERWRAEEPLREAQRLAEAKTHLRTAANKLDRDALDRLFDGYPTRSAVTIARVLGISRHNVELAAEVGLLQPVAGRRATVFTKDAVLAALL